MGKCRQVAIVGRYENGATNDGRMGHHAMMDPAQGGRPLDKLKTDLKLTSAQRAGWQRYARLCA